MKVYEPDVKVYGMPYFLETWSPGKQTLAELQF